MPPSSSEKRKTVFKKIDETNLLSRHPPKKQKTNAPELKSSNVRSSTLVKTLVVELDPPSSKVTPDVSTPNASCPTTDLSTIPPVVEDLVDISRTLLKSESLAWSKFKTVVKHEEVMACFDMFVKEFECFTIHDLFKVCFLVHNNL